MFLWFRRILVHWLTAAFLCPFVMTFTGCGSTPQPKTPQEIEKSRLEHGRAAQRELSDG